MQETVEQPDVGAVVDQRPVERRRLYGILGQLHAEIVGDGQQQGRQPVVREKLPENPFARQDDGAFGQLPGYSRNPLPCRESDGRSGRRPSY